MKSRFIYLQFRFYKTYAFLLFVLFANINAFVTVCDYIQDIQLDILFYIVDVHVLSSFIFALLGHSFLSRTFVFPYQ